MQGIGGIGHVAVRVAQVERALAFYEGRLGFAEMFRLHRDDGHLALVYLRITDGQYLELFPDAESDRAPPPEANGLNHLCLTVDDLDALAARLGDAGVPLARPIITGADGNRQAWIDDPEGNRVELMEMNPDGMQARAIQRMRALAGTSSALGDGRSSAAGHT